MKKKMRKSRQLAWVLVLSMLLLVLPTSALAAEEEYDATDAVSFVFSEDGILTDDTTHTSDYKIDGTTLTVKAAGTYILSGSCADGSVSVKKSVTDVTLVLNGLTLANTGSATSATAPLTCGKSTGVRIVAAAGTTNTLSDSEYNNDETYTENGDAENAVIKCKDGSQVTLTGSGTLNVVANGKNGIKSGTTDTETDADNPRDAFLTIENLTLNITANMNDAINAEQLLTVVSGTLTVAATDDAIHSDLVLVIGAEGTEGPTIDITASTEGIEGATISICSGDIRIAASDDCINAANADLTDYDFSLTISGGTIYAFTTTGDGFDSNGTLTVSGGNVEVWSANTSDNQPLDADGMITISGGTVLAAGGSNSMGTKMSEAQEYIIFGSSGNQRPGGQRSGSQQPGGQQSGGQGNLISAGDTVEVTDSEGNVIYTATAPCNAAYVLYSSAEISSEEDYSLVSSKASTTETSASTTETSTAETSATSASTTETSTAETSATEASTTETSTVETSATEPSVTEPSASATEPSVTEPSDIGGKEILYGDCNEDGTVNMKDVLVLRKYLAQIEVTINTDNADATVDGAVNMKDVLILRKYLAGLVDSLGPVVQNDVLGKVTAIDGDTITLEMYSQQGMGGETPPSMPDEETSDASASEGQTTPPEKPEGESSDSEAAPSMPGETKTITVTDTSLLYKLDNQVEVQAELSDITVGAVLKITYNGETIQKIVIGTESDFSMGGQGGQGGEGGQGGQGGSDVSLTYEGATEILAAANEDGEEYVSEQADQSALLISTDENVTILNATVNKTGDSDGGDNCNFYGLNAAVLVKDGSTTTITGGEIFSDASGANGVFCYGGNGGQNGAAGDGTTVNISDTVITTTGDGSGGIMTTGGGITNANNLTVTTSGQSSAAIRTDRGGGTVTVDGGTYTTNGLGSPAIYSTADITVSNATLLSNLSEGVCIEGLNSIELNNVTLTANNTKCNGNAQFYDTIMMYQSMSGDAASGTSAFTMNGGALVSKNGHVFHVTNTNAVITLDGVAITNEDSENVLLSVCDDGWSGGENNATLNAANQVLNGAILVGDNSTLTLNLSEESSFVGSIGGTIQNASGKTVSTEVGTVSVTLDGTSTWTLTGDSYVTGFTGDASQIISNGYTLYVNGVALTGTN